MATTNLLRLKSEVDFEHPSKTGEMCRDCQFYVHQTRSAAGNRCMRVIGHVEPVDHCARFELVSSAT